MPGDPRSPGALPAGAARFAWLQAGAGGLTQLTQRGGVLAVALLVGPGAQAGFAALAIGIALAATYAVAQLFTVALPVLAERAAVDGDAGTSESALRRLAGLQLAVLTPAMLLAVPLLDTAVPLVFGAGYAGAADAFAPALAAVLLAPVAALAVQAAALRMRPAVTLYAALLGAGAFVLVAALAVPVWGATGATLAALAGTSAGAAASVRLLPRAAGAPLAGTAFAGAAVVTLLGVVA